MSNTRPPGAATAVHLQITLTVNTGMGYRLAILALPPYHPGVPLHQHPAHTETCTITQGMLALTYDGRTVTLAQGQSIVIPPGVTHTYWNPTAAATTLAVSYEPEIEVNDIAVLAGGVASDLVVYGDTNTDSDC